MSGLPGDRTAAGVLAVLLFAVAVFTVALGETAGLVLLSDQVVNALYVLAYLLPVAGMALLGAVFWAAWNWSRGDVATDSFVDAGRREGQRTDGRVGQDIESRLEAAAIDWYRCEESYSVADIRERLEESAVRALTASAGFDEERAREALEDGSWTDDPVAAAFLSPRRGQPLGERLRGALDPGQGFHRRVDRTVAAIELLEDDSPRAVNKEGVDENERSVTGEPTRETGEVLAE